VLYVTWHPKMRGRGGREPARVRRGVLDLEEGGHVLSDVAVEGPWIRRKQGDGCKMVACWNWGNGDLRCDVVSGGQTSETGVGWSLGCVCCP